MDGADGRLKIFFSFFGVSSPYRVDQHRGKPKWGYPEREKSRSEIGA